MQKVRESWEEITGKGQANKKNIIHLQGNRTEKKVRKYKGRKNRYNRMHEVKRKKQVEEIKAERHDQYP